jgi:TonB family protein
MFHSIALQTTRSPRGPALSLMIHGGAIALLFLAGTNRGVQRGLLATAKAVVPLIAPYIPAAHSGGGGSGDRSPLPASLGRLPKIAARQFTPPLAVINNANPILVMEPTIVISPDVSLPQVNLAVLGDPFGKNGPQSNGHGKGGGIGDGDGTGVGPGKGPGVGPGDGGDFGGLRSGGGALTSPVLLYKVEPEFSEEARQAKHQGVVVLYGEVDTNGTLRNIRVLQGLGLGLDDKAIQAVKQWRFRPGYRDGKPVVAAATIEVNFHLL